MREGPNTINCKNLITGGERHHRSTSCPMPVSFAAGHRESITNQRTISTTTNVVNHTNHQDLKKKTRRKGTTREAANHQQQIRNEKHTQYQKITQHLKNLKRFLNIQIVNLKFMTLCQYRALSVGSTITGPGESVFVSLIFSRL